MPNQLSQSKRRQSLAEHTGVLAALATIAEHEDTTVLDLLRSAAREIVRKRAALPLLAKDVRKVVWQSAPQLPGNFRTAAQLARFKRAQREYDQVLLDLGIAAPSEIQARNSIVPASESIRLINFDRAHAAPL